MKKFISILILIALTLTIASCGSNYKLQEGDMAYIPYEGDEILVFESDQNRMDTIFLRGLRNFNGCGDPLAFFPDKCEGKSLDCTRTDPNYDRYLDGKQLVKLTAGSNGASHISFDIALKGSWFYGMEHYTLEKFDNLPDTKLTIRNRTYDDVKIFEAGAYAKQFEHRDNYAERFYWSSSDGFLGLDRRDEKWRLVKKQRR